MAPLITKLANHNGLSNHNERKKLQGKDVVEELSVQRKDAAVQLEPRRSGTEL